MQIRREGSVVVSGIGRVIVGASASPGSLPALRYAVDLARQNDAPLIAVHAWVPPGGDHADRMQPSPDLRQIWREAAWKRLHDALDSAWAGAPAGLDLQCLVLRGEPGPVLIDVACQVDDVLVVGSGRRGPLARIRHGRVGRYCVARARCPVLSVPSPALTRRAARGLRAWSLRRRKLTVDQAVREWEGEMLGRGSR